MALDELIDNAGKFSPKGENLTLEVIQDARGDVPSVEISVSDQGNGMSPALQQMVFEEFVQADSSDTRAFGGLGLGLSLVR